MASGGKISCKRDRRDKVRLEKKGSDESDEDYRVDEDEEFEQSEDDYCSSLAEDESEESLGVFDDEEEEVHVENKVTTKKVGRPRGRKAFKRRKKYMFMKPRKKNISESEEEEEYDDYFLSGVSQQEKNKFPHEEDDIEVLFEEDENDFVDGKPRKNSRIPRTEICMDSYSEDPNEKVKVPYSEVKEYGGYEQSDDSGDEEFTPDEVVNSSRREPVGKQVLRKKDRFNLSKGFKADNSASRKRKTIKEWGWGRSKRETVAINSDSDFVSSQSSDYEYTISEEERDQIAEATHFCKKLSTNFRNSSSLMRTEEGKLAASKGKRPGRRCKQKVVDLNIEIVKQVCGICLSEEGTKTVRGVLDCCSHYFCFDCIMEWSKVESRCPLCKQRFATISRTAQMDGGNDLSGALFPVPQRDQVYQPSEEELRGYLDPYENFLCTECLQGGEDALMLLCDLCDSPAHTFCVGLGREVPDGNWYCNGCRQTAFAYDHGASNNFSVGLSPGFAARETFDLNEAYIPDIPFSHSPRHYSVEHLQPTSPAAAGAFTLHDIRRIQRVIREVMNSTSRQPDAVASASEMNHFVSPIDHAVIASEDNIVPRVQRVLREFMNSRSQQSDGVTPAASETNPFGSPIYGENNIVPRIRRVVREYMNSRSEQADGVSPAASEINHFGSPIETQTTVVPSRTRAPQTMYNRLSNLRGGQASTSNATFGIGSDQQQPHPHPLQNKGYE